MFIVGSNLKSLMEQFEITDYPNSFDNTSLTLRLSRQIKRIECSADCSPVVYGNDIPDEWIKDEIVTDAGYELHPRMSILACSIEYIRMPVGYIGLIQTKGSLARLFITVQCCDAQVEPGYEGRVTFEIVNLGPMKVVLRGEQDVAQLFVARTSTTEVAPYKGRYQGASGPTAFRKPV